MAFPGATPSYAGFTSSHTLAADSHAAQHNQEQADITALANKVGTGASTPTSGMLLRGTGVGTSAWAQVTLTSDVTGVLPQANGGTGTTNTTGTGSVVFGTSPTLVTPTLTTPSIGSFASAAHNHQNAAGGGTLAAEALPALNYASQTLRNPYKFSAYRNAAQNTTGGSFAKVNYDTELFDTSNNFDAVTNARFTAPVAGFYQFNAMVSSASSSAAHTISFYLNGVEFSRGNKTNGTGAPGATHNDLIQLAAGDFVEVYVFSTSTVAIEVGATAPHATFSGFFVSNT